MKKGEIIAFYDIISTLAVHILFKSCLYVILHLRVIQEMYHYHII